MKHEQDYNTRTRCTNMTLNITLNEQTTYYITWTQQKMMNEMLKINNQLNLTQEQQRSYDIQRWWVAQQGTILHWRHTLLSSYTLSPPPCSNPYSLNDKEKVGGFFSCYAWKFYLFIYLFCFKKIFSQLLSPVVEASS